jgi:hypothetical protein
MGRLDPNVRTSRVALDAQRVKRSLAGLLRARTAGRDTCTAARVAALEPLGANDRSAAHPRRATFPRVLDADARAGSSASVGVGLIVATADRRKLSRAGARPCFADPRSATLPVGKFAIKAPAAVAVVRAGKSGYERQCRVLGGRARLVSLALVHRSRTVRRRRGETSPYRQCAEPRPPSCLVDYPHLHRSPPFRLRVSVRASTTTVDP